MPTTLMKLKAVIMVSGTNSATNANAMKMKGITLTPYNSSRSLTDSSTGSVLKSVSSAASRLLHFHHITPAQNSAATTTGPMASSSIAGCNWLMVARR